MAGLMYMLYAVEDAVAAAPEIVAQNPTTQLMCKFLCLLNKRHLLYVSSPAMALFDDRALRDEDMHMGSPTIAAECTALREGGVVRPMLKILLLMVRFDKSESAFSLVLLRYYVLQDPQCYEKVKASAKLGDAPVPPGAAAIQAETGKPKKSGGYSLLDIAFRGLPDKLKLHSLDADFFTGKVVPNAAGLLERHKGHGVGKDGNIFENNGFSFFYLLASLTQQLHFEMLGITRYQDLPEKDERSKRLKELLKLEGKNWPNKIQQLISLVGELLRHGYISPPTCENVRKLMQTELQRLVDCCKARNLLPFLPKAGLSLPAVYSFIDTNRKAEQVLGSLGQQSADKAAEKSVQDAMDGFASAMRTYIGTLMGLAWATRDTPEKFADQFTVLLLGIKCFESIQPCLLFVTTHCFCPFDAMISGRQAEGAAVTVTAGGEKEKEVARLAEELEEKVQEKFGFIPIPKRKMGTQLFSKLGVERDEWREESEELAGSQYRKLLREQTNESGVWFDRTKYREHLQLYAYVRSKYDKLLSKCALHNYMKSVGRASGGSFDEFVKLDLSRDKQGRAMRMKRFDFPGAIEKSATATEKEGFSLTYGYLRGFYLKKLMLATISGNHQGLYKADFLRSDFRHKLMSRLFSACTTDPEIGKKPPEPGKKVTGESAAETHDEMSQAGSAISASPRSPPVGSAAPAMQLDECLPKSMLASSLSENA